MKNLMQPLKEENTKITPILTSKKYKLPNVHITLDCLAKIKALIDESDIEVAWLNFVHQDDDDYTIYDIIIPEQEASGVTAEIEEEGLQLLANEFIEKGEFEKMSEIRCWGHSHVNMNVTPSGTDDKTFESFYKDVAYFIRIIGNKKGDLKVDFVDVFNKVQYNNIKWSIKYPEHCVALIKRYSAIVKEEKEITEKLEAESNLHYEEYKKIAKEKIKEKVREHKALTTKTSSNYVYNRNSYNSYGNYNTYKNWYEDEYDGIYNDAIEAYGYTTGGYLQITEIFEDVNDIVYFAENASSPDELKKMIKEISPEIDKKTKNYAKRDWKDFYDDLIDYYFYMLEDEQQICM